MMWTLRTSRHATEKDLLALTSPGDLVSPELREHLERCSLCDHRLAALVGFRDELHSTLLAAADKAQTPGRLLAQRQRIARRLERLGTGPAHVFRFPSTLRVARGTHVRHRWVAAAALGGLLIGLGAERVLQWPGTSQVQMAMGTTAAGQAVRPFSAPPTSRSTNAAEEAFLDELEAALETPRVTELQTIDAWTPRVLDVSLPSR